MPSGPKDVNAPMTQEQPMEDKSPPDLAPSEPPSAEQEQSLLDMGTVNTLLKISQDTGNPVFERVLDAFTQEAEKLVAQLNEHVSCAEVDLPAIGEIAHALKSMAGNSGAQALYQLCNDLEGKMKNNQADDIPSFAQRIQSVFSLSCEKLESFRHVD